MLLCKAEDPAVASATAIDDNEAEEHLDKQKLRHLMTEVIYYFGCYILQFLPAKIPKYTLLKTSAQHTMPTFSANVLENLFYA